MIMVISFDRWGPESVRTLLNDSMQRRVPDGTAALLRRGSRNLRVHEAVSSTHDFQGWIMLGTILVIVLLVLLLGAWPAWPYSRSWGYFPSGSLGLVLIVIVVLALLGRV
jgi:hypothetical protein